MLFYFYEVGMLLKYVLFIIWARRPELHFVQEVIQLKELFFGQWAPVCFRFGPPREKVWPSVL